MTKICQFCLAKLWSTETSSLCCANGQVILPPLQPLPVELHQLFVGGSSEAKDFRQHIRGYNASFAFASLGVHEDVLPAGVYSFRINGSVCHRIGHLQPNSADERPKFAQMYIYDTDHEIQNRLHWNPQLKSDILATISRVINSVNPFVQFYKHAAATVDSAGEQGKDVKMVLRADSSKDAHRYNLPTASEVAVILPGDPQNFQQRDVVIYRKSDDHPLQQPIMRINETHPHFDSLHYVLLFPKGEDGWKPHLKFNGRRTGQISPSLFYAYRIMERETYLNSILFGGRLFQQYVVDQYAKVEGQRLNYILFNQQSIRAELYDGLADAVFGGDSEGATVGKKIVLPSSFTGGPRSMIQLYQDAMAIVRRYGKPDLFLTVTCNPNWPEITNELHTHQTAADRPDLVARVFKLKLAALMQEIVKKELFGKVVAYVKVIEFQKRGLPHSHILIILESDAKPITTQDIDKLVCAEIPHDKVSRELVSRHMMHGPCGLANPNSPCMKDGKCSKKFPKSFSEVTKINDSSYPEYQRRDVDERINRNGVALDNRWVVPYNPYLLNKYRAHINLEVCNSIKAVKYMYKYVYKGHDRVMVEFQGEQPDEVKKFVDARYVSASESCWRILQFDLQDRYPAIQRLALHLPNKQSVTYREGQAEEAVRNIKDTTLTAWFKENEKNGDSKDLLYTEMPEHYTWDTKTCSWKKRQRNRLAIGRVYSANPFEGERFFLRLLLQHVRGAKSFEDMRRSTDGVLHPSFRQAASALGLLEDDEEWENCMTETAFTASPNQMRQLFATLLLFCNTSSPSTLWDTFKHQLAEDFYHQRYGAERPANDESCTDMALTEIARLLAQHKKSLKDFELPEPTMDELPAANECYNRTEQHEMSVNRQAQMNADQRSAFSSIMNAINSSNPSSIDNVFFIDGPGGTGKTFLYNTLLSEVRGLGLTAIPVASSGIAAELLSGGATAHSTFQIPIPITENSTCNISRQSNIAEKIRDTSLIIWDEAPMMDKKVFECVSRSLSDITGISKPFGGKVVVLGGDFRQILPVVPKGKQADILNATLNTSHLWSSIRVIQLTINMRVGNSDKEFQQWLLRIGNGTEQVARDTGEMAVKIPEDMCFPDAKSLIRAVYNDFSDNYYNEQYLSQRAILTTTHENVDHINMLLANELTSAQEHTYLSADSISDSGSEGHLYPIEFLNNLNPPGLPPHSLKLKVNTPVMLLRNLNPSAGLLNGTRLLIRTLGNRVIEAKIMTGTHTGSVVFIPRITLTTTHDSRLPFTLSRRQFPLKQSYAMTINKSQGQTLKRVGIYLPQPVFTHGQLYVAMSRVSSYSGLHFSVGKTDENACHTDNVVYKSALLN